MSASSYSPKVHEIASLLPLLSEDAGLLGPDFVVKNSYMLVSELTNLHTLVGIPVLDVLLWELSTAAEHSRCYLSLPQLPVSTEVSSSSLLNRIGWRNACTLLIFSSNYPHRLGVSNESLSLALSLLSPSPFLYLVVEEMSFAATLIKVRFFRSLLSLAPVLYFHLYSTTNSLSLFSCIYIYIYHTHTHTTPHTHTRFILPWLPSLFLRPRSSLES